MSAVRWLLVGAGDIARKRVAAALSSAADSALVAVCDAVHENARSLAAELGIDEVYADLGAALESSSANAVYVATPVSLHVPHAVAALESGRHVLAEKPLGVTGEQAAQAVSAAEARDLVAGCAYYRRLTPMYEHARAMATSGDFGRIVLVRMVYFSWFAPTPDDPKYWRVQRRHGGGGALSDMGTHMFDVLIGLLGMPASVYAHCANLVHDWDVEDAASILMQMPDGAQVTASFHWNSQTWRHEFEIVGSEAKVHWHPYDSGQVIVTRGRQVDELSMPPADNVHLPLVEDFVQAIQSGGQPACPLGEAARTNTLMDAVYASAAEGREVVL